MLKERLTVYAGLSLEEAEVLRERARAFLENAEYLYGRGLYDLAVFNIEQYSQLILEYKLLVKTGSYPRTHSITLLLRLLSRIDERVKVLLERDDYFILLTKLEDACIGSRYLPRRYEERETRLLLNFVKEVFVPLVGRI